MINNNNWEKEKIEKGQIYMIDLEKRAVGSEQYGIRPCIIVQNNKGNHFSPTVIVVLLTSQLKSRYLPTHVEIKKDKENKLFLDSTALCEQILTVDKKRLMKKIGKVNPIQLERINQALRISLGLC